MVFLNHGSFGACPRPVLEAQSRLREQMERSPVRFLSRELPALLDAARAELAELLGATPQDLAFVPNATTAVNAVLGSVRLASGDELLATSHVYNACRNAMVHAARRGGASAVEVDVPFPLAGPEIVLERVLGGVTPRTRLALIDHVTSPTALVFPVRELVSELQHRGIAVFVDGAHAPGMVPLALDELGADYYAGNCHKWLCAPKGVGFLHVRRDHRDCVRPAVISHGATVEDPGRSRFWLEFDWTGTDDYTPYLAVPTALRFMAELHAGGWPELMARNHALAVEARRRVLQAIGCPPPCPDSMLGAMASVPLPDAAAPGAPGAPGALDALQQELYDRYGIEIPVMPWPQAPRRLLRLSAQAYNRPDDYDVLAAALVELLPERRSGH